MRKKNLGSFCKFIAVGLVLMAIVTLTYVEAEGLRDTAPSLPHAFYGDVTINGAPAPAGTIIRASGSGVTTGPGNPLTTSVSGRYGGAGGFEPKLVVQGTVTTGAPLSFYVNGVRAECALPGGSWSSSYPFSSSIVTELDLRIVSTPTATNTAQPVATNTTQPTAEITAVSKTATFTPTADTTAVIKTATATSTSTPSNPMDMTPVPQPTATSPAGPGLGELILREGVNGYDGMDDTYIDAWQPNQNYYSLNDLKLRAQDVKRIIWRADVSMLPPGTVIAEAVLTLYQTGGGLNPMNGRVYELLKPWEPSETTWVASNDGIPWTLAGAASIGVDRSGTPTTETGLFPTWGSSPAYGFDFDITSLVQDWINAPSGNNGLIIYNGDGASTELMFASCDHFDENIRPRLMIRYSTSDTPTPTATSTGPTSTPIAPTSTPTVRPFETDTAMIYLPLVSRQ